MEIVQQLNTGRWFMARLPHGADLLEALTQFCATNAIRHGEVRAIGGLKRARVGFYDQDQKVYRYLEFDEPLEIVSLVGNISIKDGAPMVHAHVALGKADGSVVGGHLASGCIVFAGEAVIQELLPPADFVRAKDTTTGLPLWRPIS